MSEESFTCKVVYLGKRWQCTSKDGTKTWFAGESYRYQGKLASEAETKPEPLPPVTDPGREQDKGANKDPNTWDVTNMKNPPDMFKVVDDKGINVADNFKTEAGAQAYIDSKKSGVPPVEPPVGGVDKYGIKILAPMKQGGLYVDSFNYKSSVHGGKTRDTFSKNIGPCMAYAAVGYYNINLSDNSEELSNKPCGGTHSGDGDSALTRQGRCYSIGVEQNGDPSYKKEYPHHSTTPDFSDKVEFFDPNFKNVGSIKDKDFGLAIFFMADKVNKKVDFECWVDTSGLKDGKPQNQWRPFYKITDKGQLAGAAYLENQGLANGGDGLYYMRIDTVTRKSKIYGHQVYEITGLPSKN